MQGICAAARASQCTRGADDPARKCRNMPFPGSHAAAASRENRVAAVDAAAQSLTIGQHRGNQVMTTAFIRHRDCLLHDMGQHHPECPDRLHAIEDQLISSGLAGYLDELEAPLATREQLARVHDDALPGFAGGRCARARAGASRPGHGDEPALVERRPARRRRGGHGDRPGAGGQRRATHSAAYDRPAITPNAAARWDSASTTTSR